MNTNVLYKKLQTEKFFITGPCVIESEEQILEIGDKINSISKNFDAEFIFKASFDKANRSSLKSFRGLGIEKGLDILKRVKQKYQFPITTDIHESHQANLVKDIVDIIQIPAFLCRQTDLLLAAGKSGSIINVKKAQFMDGNSMKNAIDKVKSTGNDKIILTERGTMFGLSNLVVDFRQIVDMQSFGYPVVLDVTHSTQKPGSLGNKSGGEPKYAPYLTKIGRALELNGFFFETHPNPEIALSDGPNMIKLNELEKLINLAVG